MTPIRWPRLCPVALLPFVLGCAPEALFVLERDEVLNEYVESLSNRPTLVVDLDDTVVDGGLWNSTTLFFDLCYGAEPFPGAPESLCDLATRWNVVFVTARPDWVKDQTVQWLDAQGFPNAPVLFSPSPLLTSDAKRRYKAGAIGELRDRGLIVRYGVGDRASDVLAYDENGANAVLIVERSDDGDFAASFEALGATQYECGFGNVTLMTTVDCAWAGVLEHLRSRERPQ